MRMFLVSIALAALPVYAAPPNFSGVWKANFTKSNIAGPPPANYLIIIEQDGTKFRETTGAYTQRGERRSTFTYNLDTKPSINSRSGLPMRTEVSWDGAALVLKSKIAGPHPGEISEKYSLSTDENTLTVDLTSLINGQNITQTMVLDKQPESAAEPLRKPEQTAGAHFKNVTMLKDTPVSQFLDFMQNISMSLGVECDFCHAPGKFESDEKHAKVTARSMIAMTRDLNKQSFNGRDEVVCYTCHRGNHQPSSLPSF